MTTSNIRKFYRVRVTDEKVNTFVFMVEDIAELIFEYYSKIVPSVDGSRPEVVLEHVTEYGEVVFQKTQPRVTA